MYDYKAIIDKVIDGDTLDLRVNLGFGLFLEDRFRLARIDCPEMNTPEGIQARDYVTQFELQSVIVKTPEKPKDKYGRFLAIIHLQDGRCLNDELLSKGFAKPMKGANIDC